MTRSNKYHKQNTVESLIDKGRILLYPFFQENRIGSVCVVESEVSSSFYHVWFHKHFVLKFLLTLTQWTDTGHIRQHPDKNKKTSVSFSFFLIFLKHLSISYHACFASTAHRRCNVTCQQTPDEIHGRDLCSQSDLDACFLHWQSKIANEVWWLLHATWCDCPLVVLAGHYISSHHDIFMYLAWK